LRNPRRFGRSSAVALAALMTVVPLLVATPVSAGPTCDTLPTVVPESSISAGMTGHGLTTIDGGAPSTFDVTVLGILHDAVAPGFDLVAFHLDGPAGFITNAHGVFSGMSGSPVYDDGTGDLMGAVSYSFSFADPRIGLFTPAEQMLKVLDETAATPSMPARIAAPKWLQRRMPRLGSTEGSGSFTILRTPFVVPPSMGLQNRERKHFGIRTLPSRTKGLHLKMVAGSAAAPALAPDPTPIDPGVPLSAMLSSGDVTYAGIGTTTFKCGNSAGDLNAGWGHEFFGDGPTSFAMGSANVLTIVDDPSGIFGPFMLAEPADLHGTVLQDRLRGVVGEAGAGPTSFPVTSDVTNVDTSNERTGQTDVYYQKDYWGPEIAFSHVWSNELSAFDAFGAGTGQITYTIDGTADGDPFEVTNTNFLYSQYSVFYASYKLLYALYALRFNRQNVDVEFTSVDATVSLTQDQVTGKISRVLTSSPLDPNLAERGVIHARPGQTIHVVVGIKPVDGSANHTVAFDFKVPNSARRSDQLLVRGGSRRVSFSSRGTHSFDQLVKKLNGGEHPNDVVAEAFGAKTKTPADLEVLGKRSITVRVV